MTGSNSNLSIDEQ
jgi:hypothetical protein